MRRLDETEISKAIIRSYHSKLLASITSDVLIVGAGPAGMVAAARMAASGLRVTLLEKRLAAGGGVWGGGMAMNEAVIQEEALPVLDEANIRHKPTEEGLHTVDTMEMAAGLCLQALHAGARLLNLTSAEDVCVLNGRVAGIVANRTTIAEALPIDPITFSAKATIDATGHEAVVVESLRKRGLVPRSNPERYLGEGPMDATGGEAFVVNEVAEVFPGLWVTGMSVSAALGGPRMGPIFGGMLLSGRRVADLVMASLD